MKNKNIVRAHESAKIYHSHYKPSLNIFRFVKSVLGIFISGSSPAGSTSGRRK